jgi:DNA invertase Pin-like site-specific DNA recombinase
MRIAIYARVSTSDKDQNVDTQLVPLREFAAAQNWTTTGKFVDHASATDLRGRTAWRDLLDYAAKRRVDVILCWKLDRAFRSVAHMAQTVDQLRRWGVGLRSYSEPWLDTSGTSPVADLMLNILASFAQFEKALIAERVRAGMTRARRQGAQFGRPRVQLNGEWAEVRQQLQAGGLSQRAAARRLGVSQATVCRLIHNGSGNGPSETRLQQGLGGAG